MPIRSYKVPVGRPVRIYCDGVYDLFHYGHARSSEQAKSLFLSVYLLAGVTGDDATIKFQGNPVMSAPWEIIFDFLQKHKIDFVAHDDIHIPYRTDAEDDVYKMVKGMGIFIPIR